MFQGIHVSKEKPAFIYKSSGFYSNIYTGICCTEGHVKSDVAYYGYICFFLCNLMLFVKNSMSELGSWSCRGTGLWIGDNFIMIRFSIEDTSVFQAL